MKEVGFYICVQLDTEMFHYRHSQRIHPVQGQVVVLELTRDTAVRPLVLVLEVVLEMGGHVFAVATTLLEPVTKEELVSNEWADTPPKIEAILNLTWGALISRARIT